MEIALAQPELGSVRESQSTIHTPIYYIRLPQAFRSTDNMEIIRSIAMDWKNPNSARFTRYITGFLPLASSGGRV